MNKIEKDGTVNHGSYKIAQFTANKKKFYQPRIKIKNGWWCAEKFFGSIIEAGDYARKIVYK